MPRALWYPIPVSVVKSGFGRIAAGEVVAHRLVYTFSTRLDYIAAVINDNERWPLHVIA